MNIKKVFCYVSGFLLVSCSAPKDIAYFQDVTDKSKFERPDSKISLETPVINDLIFRPGDEVGVVIKSLSNKELNDMFLMVTVREGSSSMPTSRNHFVIDENGNIDLPGVGIVKAEGYTRSELEKAVREKVVNDGLAKDATVTVSSLNLGVTLIGEVNRPGRYEFDNDHMTILEALAMGKDLTINGMRENVTVVRNVEGKDVLYKVNLLSMEDVVKSPAYFLCQNDVVYVVPTKKRRRQSTPYSNQVYTTRFWVSLSNLELKILRLIKRYK